MDSSRGSRDWFGFALSVGDFNRDGRADLVVGVPGEGYANGRIRGDDSGMAHIFYGTSKGLSSDGALGRETLREATRNGRPSVVEVGDQFGWALP